MRGITFLAARLPFCVTLLLSSFTLPSQMAYLLNGPCKDIIFLWVVFCVMISWVNQRKYENILQFNTSWLTSVRAWYYFRLCFSFSCSGSGHTLTKKSHALNGYSFLRKFCTNSLLVDVVAQFTAKTNSEKAIYFLSLTSCLINKVSHVIHM